MAVSSPLGCVPRVGDTVADSLWNEVAGPVEPFLARVSAKMAGQASEFDPEVSAFALYALEKRGKLLRPALVGLSGGATGELEEGHVTVAAVVEMIHLATLVHDDIMDLGEVRRGRPTVSSRWGNSVAVLVGDSLFAHALLMAAELDSISISRRIALATKRVCSGEISQTLRRKRWSITLPEYFRVIELKTAELFALACELGVEVSGGSAVGAAALARYARALGVAYQIYDDCADLFGSEQEQGKSLGTDLATGKLTLPLLLTLDHAAPGRRREIQTALDQGGPGIQADLRGWLDESGSLAASARILEQRLDEARAACDDLVPSPFARSLQALPDFLAAKAAVLGG